MAHRRTARHRAAALVTTLVALIFCGLATFNATAATPGHTAVRNLYPLTSSFRLKHGYHIVRTINGRCNMGDQAATYAYYCSGGNTFAYTCFPMHGGDLVCPGVMPWKHDLLAYRPTRPVSGKVRTHNPPVIASELASGRRCFEMSHFDIFGSHRVSWFCGGNRYLLDKPTKHAHRLWTQAAVSYTHGRYQRAGTAHIRIGWVERGRCRKAGSDGGPIPICQG